MNYVLAKELKDAGFPQADDGPGHYVCECTELKDVPYDDGTPRKEVLGADHEQVYAPTLSELIKACAKTWFILHRDEKTEEWSAQARWSNTEDDWYKTPEEAVARLWLKLKKV